MTQPQVQGYVAGHAVTNIFYILRRQVGSERARELLSRLLQHLQIANVTDEVIRAALQSSMTDFEDAVTNEAANAADVEIIVTRNMALRALIKTTGCRKAARSAAFLQFKMS